METRLYMIFDMGSNSYVRESKHGGFRYYTKIVAAKNYVKDLKHWCKGNIKKDFMVGPDFRVDEFELVKMEEGV